MKKVKLFFWSIPSVKINTTLDKIYDRQILTSMELCTIEVWYTIWQVFI